MTERKRALLLHRQGSVTMLDFYNKRRTDEGPTGQILSATDQLLELLLEIDKQIRERMNKQLMSDQIQRELAEYRTLTNDEDKADFWERVRAADAQLTKDDHLLINQVIYDDLQEITVKTKGLLCGVELAKATS